MKRQRQIVLLTAIICSLTFSADMPAVSAAAEETETEKTAETRSEQRETLERDDWADDVKAAVNDFVAMYGKDGDHYNESEYVVFDFDNTCSIFDVEEQLAVYQLETMSFAMEPNKLPEVLKTGLGDLLAAREGYAVDESKHSYQEWLDDISKAYEFLYENYGPFTAAGLDEEKQVQIQEDDQWKEFATKMRAMYDLVYDNESAEVAYPWVLYWFTGMTEREVYELAYKSHKKYMAVETSEVLWSSPDDLETKVGQVEYTWTSGVQVSENIRELWKLLYDNGIDVWVCSASGTDPIRAAVDAWDLSQYVTGVMAMTNQMKDGVYVNAYDYETGYPWYCKDGSWNKGTTATQAQTQGVGKTTAINKVLVKEYGCGPMAGFMDSTGDFNFCTEFSSLKLVICFNRASRKVTDGGGLAAETAIYQRDTLQYDLKKANDAGDTLYVLQGRDENGLRSLRNSNLTLRFGSEEEQLFKNEENEQQLQYMIDQNMTTEEIFSEFSLKTAADDDKNVLGYKYGFLDEYAGYHVYP